MIDDDDDALDGYDASVVLMDVKHAAEAMWAALEGAADVLARWDGPPILPGDWGEVDAQRARLARLRSALERDA